MDVFSASGIDDAVDLLTINNKTSANLDRHPERRLKSAYAEYEELHMPILKQENPGLRQSQLKQMLQKKWKRAPENPLNQASLAYNASREEAQAATLAQKETEWDKFKQ